MSSANNLQNMLNEAIGLFQSGNSSAAESILSTIIQANRNIPVVWFLFGAVTASLSKDNKSIDAFKKCLQLQAVYPEAHYNLAVVLEKEGKSSQALNHYKKSVQQKPDYVAGLFGLGNILQTMGQIDEAIKHYKKLLTLEPGHIKTLNNIALCYKQYEDFPVALNYLKLALAQCPNDVEILTNLSSIQMEMKQYSEAKANLHKALQIAPRSTDALNNLALCEQKVGKFDEAKALFKQLISQNPQFSNGIYNLANLYKESGDILNATQQFKRVLAVNPKHAKALSGLGTCALYENDINEAISLHKQALKLSPADKTIQYNLSTCLLGNDQLKEAWPLYQARQTTKHALVMNPLQITLNNLKGKRVLLIGEQGIGDELFFLRYLSTLENYTSDIEYLTNPKLLELFRQIPSIVKLHTEEKTLGHYDFVISVGDLPLLFQKNNEHPASIHLSPTQDNLQQAITLLKNAGPPPYTGISWRAGQNVKGLLYKESPMEPLLETTQSFGGTVVILQRNPTPEDLDTIKRNADSRPILDLSSANDNLPLMLAILDQIDFYIGVSNTNIHLRAALGKAADVIVTFPPEWRWGFQGASTWFPNFNVYRQEPNLDWQSVFNRINRLYKQNESNYAKA